MIDDTILPIDHPLLETCSAVVTEFDGSLAELADDLFDVMDEEGGAGLAAIQVGCPHKLLVIDQVDASGTRHRYAMANAEITVRSDTLSTEDEACLSMPGYLIPVPRHNTIEVDYQTLEGEYDTLIADGPLAVCLQHSIDLTNGILFVDRVSKQRRTHADDISKRARRRAVFH